MSSSRPAITCHVLDTTLGLPANSIPVTLTIQAGSASHSMTASTDSDGRVGAWSSMSGDTISQVFAQNEGDFSCVLSFETAAYWEKRGIKAFFPRVDIAFVTTGFKDLQGGKEPHWHVPLLLGPYNYTTYRGS